MSSDLTDLAPLSPERLTQVLRDGKALPPDRRVAGSTVVPMDGGYLSRTARVLLDYDTAVPGAPASLVAKSPAADPLARTVATMMGMYAREVHFYRELAPRVTMRTPRHWSSSVDPETGEFTLLIEDVQGATMHDQTDGCPADDARLAIRELARLHSATWDDPSLAKLEWLNQLSPAAVGMWHQLFHHAWHAFIARDEVELAPELLAVGAALDGSDFVAWICGQTGPLALAHADFHLANLLFLANGKGEREVVTVDWQMAMHAPPLVDVAYFAGRMPTDARRETERELVGAYHSGLVEAGVTGYSLERCWEDYQRWIWFGVFSAVAASAAYSMSPDEVRRYTGKVARYLTQALDHNAVRFLG